MLYRSKTCQKNNSSCNNELAATCVHVDSYFSRSYPLHKQYLTSVSFRKELVGGGLRGTGNDVLPLCSPLMSKSNNRHYNYNNFLYLFISCMKRTHSTGLIKQYVCTYSPKMTISFVVYILLGCVLASSHLFTV